LITSKTPVKSSQRKLRIIILALIFDFLNGVHDSSNVVATMISSRALPPRVALWMTAAANFVGPFIFGVAVAETIGNEVVKSEAISLPVILVDCLLEVSLSIEDADTHES
jgi:PiT family inorganic phosphate transporter